MSNKWVKRLKKAEKETFRFMYQVSCAISYETVFFAGENKFRHPDLGGEVTGFLDQEALDKFVKKGVVEKLSFGTYCLAHYSSVTNELARELDLFWGEEDEWDCDRCMHKQRHHQTNKRGHLEGCLEAGCNCTSFSWPK